jgi:hypothetical protein
VVLSLVTPTAAETPQGVRAGAFDREIQIPEFRDIHLQTVTQELGARVGGSVFLHDSDRRRAVTLGPGTATARVFLEQLAHQLDRRVVDLLEDTVLFESPDLEPETSWLQGARGESADPKPPYEDISHLLDDFPDDDMGLEDDPDEGTPLGLWVQFPDAEDVSLGGLMATLGRLSGLDIRVDPELETRRISTDFQPGSIRKVLEQLAERCSLRLAFPKEGVVTLAP